MELNYIQKYSGIDKTSYNDTNFGKVLWNVDFSNPNIITSSSNYYITKKDGRDCLYVSASTSALVTVDIKAPFFNFNAINNTKFVASLECKSSNVSGTSNTFISKYLDADESNSENWVTLNLTSGTYDWTSFEYINPDVPKNVIPQYAKLTFRGPGEFWITNYSFRVFQVSQDRNYSVSSYTPDYKIGRGANINCIATLKDMIDFKNTYNGNLVRLQMIDTTWSAWISSETASRGVPWLDNQIPDVSSVTTTNISAYYNWIDYKISRMDEIIRYAKMNDIKVIIDMHKPVGGNNSDINPLATINDEYCYHYYKVWEILATKYKDNDTIFAYDLINEPYEKKMLGRGTLDRNYDKLQRECVNIIRRIDPNVKLIVEFNNYAGPEQGIYLSAIDDPNIIYSFHTYFPGTYVDIDNTTSAYPSGCFYQGEPVNKNVLRKVVQPIRDFQLKYQVPIFVGEFSCYRWNPGGNLYLKDYVDIFNEYGWHWAYFSFRDNADSWDLEFNDLPAGQNNSSFALSSTPRNDSIIYGLSANESLFNPSEQTPIPPSLSAEQYNDNKLEVKWNWPNCFARKFNVRMKESTSDNWNLVYSLNPLTASILNSATISGLSLLKNYDVSVELSSTYGATSSTIQYNITQQFPITSGTSGISRAFSLRKINSNYSGNCIRVRRSSDNSEFDIGFDSVGYLNTSALLSSCSGTNGYIVTWYDQISNNNINNLLSASQPIIVSAGNIFTVEENNLPCVYFGVNNSYLSGSPSLVSTSGASVYVVKKDTQTTATGSFIGEFHTSSTSTLYSFYRTSTKNLGIVLRYDAGSSIFGDIFTSATNTSSVHQICISDTKTNIGAYLNNSSIRSPNQNYTQTSAITVNVLSVGARYRSFIDQYYSGKIQEIIFLSNGSTDNDRTYISRNQVRHYNC